jgi:hypothetical protein
MGVSGDMGLLPLLQFIHTSKASAAPIAANALIFMEASFQKTLHIKFVANS